MIVTRKGLIAFGLIAIGLFLLGVFLRARYVKRIDLTSMQSISETNQFHGERVEITGYLFSEGYDSFVAGRLEAVGRTGRGESVAVLVAFDRGHFTKMPMFPNPVRGVKAVLRGRLFSYSQPQYGSMLGWRARLEDAEFVEWL